MNPTIDEHDFQVRLKNTLRFLKDGDKVKVSIRFRGRQMAHTKLGEQVLNKMAESIKEVGVVEKKPKMEGRNMIMVLSPKQTTTKE
jgi:translation initiation factor IF-3